MAIQCYFAGTPEDYSTQFTAWVEAVRPARCPHCGREGVCVLWGCYQRWVYTTTERLRIAIMRVRCTVCHATDALLPSFLHMYRRYTAQLIQQTLYLVCIEAVWGVALVELVAPYGYPAPATLREWVYSFIDSALAWLLDWLRRALTTLVPLALPDPAPLPTHIASSSPSQRDRFSAGWQALRLAEQVYASTRARQPDLAFRPETLLAFLAAARGATGRPPRILWPQANARAP